MRSEIRKKGGLHSWKGGKSRGEETTVVIIWGGQNSVSIRGGRGILCSPNLGGDANLIKRNKELSHYQMLRGVAKQLRLEQHPERKSSLIKEGEKRDGWKKGRATQP